MEDQVIEHERGSERNFGIVFTAIFTIIGGYLYWKSSTIVWWPFAVSVVLLVTTIAIPRILYWPNFLWFKFGLLLGSIIAPLIMAVVYLLVMVPLGLLIRLFGKDLLRLELSPESDSYWIDRESPPQPMKNQF